MASKAEVFSEKMAKMTFDEFEKFIEELVNMTIDELEKFKENELGVVGENMRYKAKCQDCDFETYSYILEDTAQGFAEEHMMQTGHIVEIEKV